MTDIVKRVWRAGEADVGISLDGREARELYAEIERLAADNERLQSKLKTMHVGYERCKIEIEGQDAVIERLRKVVEAVRGARNATDNEQFCRAMDAVAEALRELEKADDE